MKLSIIICTRNGAATIADSISCAGRQLFVSDDTYEVIVVDNGSVDETRSRAASALGSLRCRTTLIEESREGKLNAILVGLAISKAPLVSIVDDDNLICDQFVFRSVNMLHEIPELGMIGSVNALFADDPPGWFAWTAGWFACGEPWLGGEVRKVDEFRTIGSRGVVAGAGSTFRKQVFLAALDKGFSFMNDAFRGQRMLSGGDTELCYLFQHFGYWFGADTRITLRHRIDPSRLQWRYALKLHRSIGAGGVAVDAFLLMSEESMASPLKDFRATWWWMAARRVRRIANLLPAAGKALLARKKIDPVWLRWEEQLGALTRILRERGRFTKRMRAMWGSEWAKLRRGSHSDVVFMSPCSSDVTDDPRK